MRPGRLGDEIKAVDILHTESFSDGEKQKKEEIFIWKKMRFFLSQDIFNIFHVLQMFLQHFYQSLFK